ncbi:hypothetical protein ANCDUO_11339 [Ancylostoma duodenale]|uniref:Uncharacterized protein n=1 Tax=Ancylostoma duodenale TaxID=51022 RepID=A0A0C2GHY5_9BILA|nr:hypothetical protein ANCDUO_11339 [Ancylostoma duodenale]
MKYQTKCFDAWARQAVVKTAALRETISMMPSTTEVFTKLLEALLAVVSQTNAGSKKDNETTKTTPVNHGHDQARHAAGNSDNGAARGRDCPVFVRVASVIRGNTYKQGFKVSPDIGISVECGYGGAKFPAHILPSLLGPPLVGSSQKPFHNIAPNICNITRRMQH